MEWVKWHDGETQTRNGDRNIKKTRKKNPQEERVQAGRADLL